MHFPSVLFRDSRAVWTCRYAHPAWLLRSAKYTASMIDGKTSCSTNSKIYEVHLVLVYCQEENVILFLIHYFIHHSLLPLALPHATFYHLLLCTLEAWFCSLSCLLHMSEKHLSFFWVCLVLFWCCGVKSPASDVAFVFWANAWSSRVKKKATACVGN